MNNAPGAYRKYAPGAVCIQIMLLEHIGLIILLQITHATGSCSWRSCSWSICSWSIISGQNLTEVLRRHNMTANKQKIIYCWVRVGTSYSQFIYMYVLKHTFALLQIVLPYFFLFSFWFCILYVPTHLIKVLLLCNWLSCKCVMYCCFYSHTPRGSMNKILKLNLKLNISLCM